MHPSIRLATFALLPILTFGASAAEWNTATPPTAPLALRCIAAAGDKFIAAGDGGTVLTSPDGIAWTARTSGVTTSLRDVLWTGSLAVACGDADTVITSPDGITWTVRDSGFPATHFGSLAWNGSHILAAGSTSAGYAGICRVSADGITWTSAGVSASVAGARSGEFVAVGGGLVKRFTGVPSPSAPWQDMQTWQQGNPYVSYTPGSTPLYRGGRWISAGSINGSTFSYGPFGPGPQLGTSRGSAMLFFDEFGFPPSWQSLAGATTLNYYGPTIGGVEVRGGLNYEAANLVEAGGSIFAMGYESRVAAQGSDLPSTARVLPAPVTDVAFLNGRYVFSSSAGDLFYGDGSQSAYEAWVAAKGLTPLGAAPGADPDNDGNDNTVELADGTHPGDAASVRPRLSLSANGPGSVTASVVKAVYDYNEVVTLTATPSAGSRFSSWSGVSGAAAVVQVSMSRTRSITANFVALTPFQIWAAGQGLAGAAAALTADPDGDGIVNLMEYALGSPPAAPSAAGTEIAVQPAAAFRFHPNPAATELWFNVQATASLAGPWQNVASRPPGGTWSAGAGYSLAIDPVSGDVTVAPLSAGSILFLRLKVAGP